MPRQAKEDPASLYTKKICKEWIQNPLYNPLAKKKKVLKVSETGVYGKLKKNCKKLHNLEPRLSSKEETGEKPKKQHSITIEQCKQLQKDPTKNPKTGRNIDPTVLRGIYQRLLKECEELEKDAKPSDGPTSSEKKQLHKIRLRNALRRALRPILHITDSYENRVHFTKVIRKYNQMIEPCIQSSEEKKNTYVLVKKETNKKTKVTKTIEKIYFSKQIGSPSVYGTAFMNVGKGLGRMLRFSIKIMADRFIEEVTLLKKMSSLAEKGITPNMPITYNAFRCQSVTQKMQQEIKQNIQQPVPLTTYGRYYVVLNELATGDLHDFFRTTYTPADYESVILQVIFALRAFHKYTGYTHNDAHLGNFLYHKITPGGYWHYKDKATDIFVPNTGYLVVLWDPGLATPMYMGRVSNMPAYSPYLDYLRPLRLIESIGVSQFYIDKNMKPVPLDVYMPFTRLIQYISFYPSPNVAMDYISSRKDKYFQHILFDKQKIPKDSFVINQTPYDLS